MKFRTQFDVEVIIRNHMLPAFVSDLNYEIVAVSRGVSPKIFDRTRESLIGVKLPDFISFNEMLKIITWVEQAASENSRCSMSIPCLTVNVESLNLSVDPVADACGNIVGLLFQHSSCGTSASEGLLENVCNNPAKNFENLKSPNTLENEFRLKTALQSAHQGVWDHDFELNTHYLSETWRKMRGISINEEVAYSTEEWLKTIHPNDIEQVFVQLELQRSGQTDVINYKFRQRHANGRWMWILSRGRVVRRDADGFPVRIIGTDTDISDLKAVELERTKLAERLRVAIDAAEMGQWDLVVSTEDAFWDDRSLQIFGVKDGHNERSEASWASFIHPDDRKATVAYNNLCLRERKDIACDYRIITPDGFEKYIRTRGKLVTDPEIGDRYIGVNIDLTVDYRKTIALEDALDRRAYESRHDVLTGLANRRKLDEYIIAQTADPKPFQLAAMHFDINKFKQINNKFGKGAGDFTLKHAAFTLREFLPKKALVARIGGNEFIAVFLLNGVQKRLTDIAGEIIRKFSLPFLYGDVQVKSGISIGISDSNICGHVGNLLRTADLALQHAKKDVRAFYQVYSPYMKDEADKRIRMQDELIDALEHDEIICYYQPQFEAQTMKISGIEALVRWKSQKHGLIMPDQFIHVAEEMGLMSKVDEVVLSRVLADLDSWSAEGISVPPISVNISAQRLMDPGFGARLREMHIPKGKIVFELLESIFLDVENDAITENLRLFEEIGIDIEIDDFGTGHASILSLLRISPKRLKVDRELVQPIVRSHTRRHLLENIIRIGKMLEIEVVAEGVESLAHVKVLQDLKCDYLQGFALAIPMAASDMRRLLA
ncbi:MAG: diguanylate cyclase (GGDEF)-like protein/PAS domain S-box-containing protein [Candidatus Azotimanducaceae bacterium]|jgi:diguanylate cyclase (GGDEF)-like protein/PAS domain S-box-containing protein